MNHMDLIRAGISVACAIAVLASLFRHIAPADEPSYKGFHTKEFEKILNDIPDPTGAAERMSDLDRLLRAVKRRAESKAIVEELNANRAKWANLSRQLDDELADVTRQARTDATLRSVASFLDLVAVAASTYDTLAGHPPIEPQEGSVVSDEKNQADGMIQHQEEHPIRVRIDGKWHTISVERLLDRSSHPSEGYNPVIREMLGQLEQWADGLPPLTCDRKSRVCTSVRSYRRSWGDEELPRGPGSDLQPTTLETGVFKTIISVGLDWTPVGDGWKLATGEDPLTGESASRLSAGVGLVAGTVGGPVAKGILKSAKNLWRLGLHKSTAKWATQFTKRKWTADQVDEAVLKGRQINAPNYVNPGNRATRYEYGKRSVVIDDKTKELLHVGEEGFDYQRLR